MALDTPNLINVQVARCCYQFKIKNSKTKNISFGNFITTPVFSAGDHEWVIKYYPQGSDADRKGTYISFCLQLLSASTTVTADYELGLINKYGTPTAESWIRSTDTFHARTSWNYSEFLKRSDLESNYIRDDHFIVVCSITVTKEPHAVLKCCAFGAFPYNLAEELRILLETQQDTDVTFEVEGENIAAHRLILASRSPVLKKELFGRMVERNSKCIKIDDMKALVFRAMLHFMYTDSVPVMDKLVTEGTLDLNKFSVILYQHLIVAADRYAVEGLKRQCEEWLCKRISIDTVVSSLDVAEQHHCDVLKKQCLAFIADPQNTIRVLLNKDYTRLAVTYPSIGDELREKVESALNHK